MSEHVSPFPSDIARDAGAFATTRWSLVIRAGASEANSGHEALQHLCKTYWYPLYAYVRRRGHSAHDAQDLTQAFFARLLERGWVSAADRERGRFRTFLLTALSRFLSDDWDRLRAQKRGGHIVHVPLQFDTGETRYVEEPAHELSPEKSYERHWALTLLEVVLQQLKEDYDSRGQTELFNGLKSCLTGSSAAQPYSEIALQLGMSEGAVKVAVHRLRKRYRQLLQSEISRTLSEEENIDDELRRLFAALQG